MLTSILQVKQVGNLPASLDETILDPHLTMAEIEMKKILTADKYDEIKALGAENENYIACSLAEANLSLAYAIPALNIETSGSGIVRTKGWDQSRSDLLSQAEVDRLVERYRSVAMDLLNPYIPQEEGTDDVPADEVKGGDWSMTAL